MKKTVLFFSIVVAQLSFAQTELIAYKSHSGDMANFKSEGYDNLGIPPMRIDTIIILNDSSIIEISSRHWGAGHNNFCVKDTVVNHPMYKESADYEKLRGNYYDTTIVFINYDTLTVKQKKKIAKKNRKKKEGYVVPVSTHFPNSNTTLLVIISLVMMIGVSLIWQFNKRKIVI